MMKVIKLTVSEKIKTSIAYVVILCIACVVGYMLIDCAIAGIHKLYSIETANGMVICFTMLGIGLCLICFCTAFTIAVMGINHIRKIWNGRMVKMINDGDIYIVDKRDITI